MYKCFVVIYDICLTLFDNQIENMIKLQNVIKDIKKSL